MKFIVPRKCRELSEQDSRTFLENSSLPVEEWEDKAAIVLLGPPGSGKTEVFTDEAKRQDGLYITARDFLTFDDKPEWNGTTLFIDGLDETRAGTADGRTPLDSIRAKLDRMGRPRFRLSCREADWFGANDRNNVKKVAPQGAVTVLRLEPLSDQDIHLILHANHGINDPEKFVATAQDRGLQGLLANPQSLKMLAVAVGSNGNWPKTRMQTFDMACRTLLVDPNEDHQVAQVDRSSISDLMDACGRLYAIQLMTGVAGYSRFGNEDDLNYLRLDQVPGQDRAILHSCLQSKLFESPTQQYAVPVHRQIAEFLAARYLAGLVENGLPVGRILALITGYDDVVVSELRGLSAWLAAHSKLSRAEAIVRDPLGTVLYGDASDFSPSEKRSVLDGLQREADANPLFVATLQLDSRLGDLVSSDMEQHFCEILIAPSREESWQSFVVIMIEALRYGEPMVGLTSPLMKLLRDDTWWPRIRLRAIESFRRHWRNDADALDELKALTDDVYSGDVPDPDDVLLSCLLSNLYSTAIPETAIMQYLRLPNKPNYCLDYEIFWIGHLPNHSTRDQLVVLLDELSERYGALLSEDRAHGMFDNFLCGLPSKLLARFLRLSGDEVDLTRLFHWLGAAAHASDWSYERDLSEETGGVIRNWFENRPDAWKTLLAMGLKGCIGGSECVQQYGFANCMHKEEQGRLLGTERPLDFGIWCLDQAIDAEDAIAVEWLLGEVAKCLHYNNFNKGLSRKVVSSRLAEYTSLQDTFDKRMNELEELTSNGSVFNRQGHSQLKTERPNWHDQVKPHEDNLREYKASPALLCELAQVYFGRYLNVRGNSPRERLNTLLADDVKLVEAVLSGFRMTIERDDLPSDRQIIRLGTSNRTHPLALPFMAGLEEMAETTPFGEIRIKEKHMRLALAVHYTVPMWLTVRHPADRPQGWFCWLLSNRPEVVAGVLERSVLSKLRNGETSPAGLYELAYSPDHETVARSVAIPLLQRFPARCTSGQLSSLNHLLLAARRHCDVEPLLRVINEKSANRSMNVAQRIHWLTFGLCIAPDTYVERLDSYATTTERRIRFLAEAVTRQFDLSHDLECRQSVPASQLLIRLIGSSCRPYSHSTDSEKVVMVTSEINAANRVRGFIEQLAAISTEDAMLALEALSSDDTLHPWHSLLIDAAYRQKALRREAEFAYGDMAQVLATLNCGAPANAADLAALTLEHLNQIARDIRDNSTSDWRQYWNVDQYSRPKNPRPENVCRDALLSDLKSRLQQFEIDVQPEGRYADDKRADIRVFHGHYNVPIEIKRSCHRSLWSAIHSQLKTRYIRDPRTGGYGIYLVFWFGDAKDCRPMPPMTGLPPTNSHELKDRLTSTLLADEQLKIRICVIDVSTPTSNGTVPT